MVMRTVLVSHDAGGTIPPMLAIGSALLARGHDVTVVGQPSIRSRAETAGAGFVAFSGLPDYDRGRSLEEQLELAGEAITGRGPGDDLLAVAADAGADLVVVDCNLAGAAAAAETLACPSALLLHSMYRTFVDVWFGTYWPFMEPGINETRRAHGLDPCASWPDLFARHDRLIAAVPAVFDAPAPTPPPGSLRHFGFLLPADAAPADHGPLLDEDDDRPLVLVSLSTTYQHQEALLGTILAALADLPVRALLTTGDAIGDADLTPPDNVLVRGFVPHQLVLPRTDVVLTHGGLGTIAGALGHGVPLVCTPIARDQPLNAQRVAEVGAGLDVGTAPAAPAIASAIERVLSEPAYREAAATIAAASGESGGAAAAAADLERLASR